MKEEFKFEIGKRVVINVPCAYGTGLVRETAVRNLWEDRKTGEMIKSKMYLLELSDRLHWFGEWELKEYTGPFLSMNRIKGQIPTDRYGN